ncbi:divalent-cation tolerance protein CutA [Lysobacter firmicutimachus]|uniref:Divalent-cation tolerance protein CutA n=1 Tax=Lysobacter firmicutimachus TaxID=1792846 RepID=A0AAU8MVI8_9GAMM|nr:divalent-cation tolerance protein CutA [Lysobacter antibioticus]
MPTPTPPVLVLSTCPDQASADAIAQTLVEERLAACVTRLPGARSTYRWQGEIEQADEVQLLIKTRVAVYPALIERLIELHPYELPEVLVVEPRDHYRPYGLWVNEQTPDR